MLPERSGRIGHRLGQRLGIVDPLPAHHFRGVRYALLIAARISRPPQPAGCRGFQALQQPQVLPAHQQLRHEDTVCRVERQQRIDAVQVTTEQFLPTAGHQPLLRTIKAIQFGKGFKFALPQGEIESHPGGAGNTGPASRIKQPGLIFIQPPGFSWQPDTIYRQLATGVGRSRSPMMLTRPRADATSPLS